MPELQHDRIGGGDGVTWARIITSGRLRWAVDAVNGALIGVVINHSEPTLPDQLPCIFFRTSGTKQQLCVKFASGVTQILATEP